MEEKKAFVFDTNFIIQNKNLDDVIENLLDNYNVYITQVSIDERIAQQCRELKFDYDKFKEKEIVYKRFASIGKVKSYENLCEMYRGGIQNLYNVRFGKNIIPIPQKDDLIDTVYRRSLNKKPPFLTALESTSDKGFKDTLIWLSVLDYFKDDGEYEVLFLSEDKGFKDNSECLAKEFEEYTGKIIKIKPNSYYKELVSNVNDEQTIEHCEKNYIPNIDELRDEIEDALYSICKIEFEDDYGEVYYEKLFTAYFFFSKEKTLEVLNNLSSIISRHVFEKRISVYEVFDTIPGEMIGHYYLRINNLEQVLKLYNRIVENYPEYLEQFITAVTKILNCNYETPPNEDDDELPF